MKPEEEQYSEYTQDNVKAALKETLEKLHSPDVVNNLTTAQELAGYNMTKILQNVFPLIVDIQNDVLQKYGFPCGREGIIKYTQYLLPLTKKDPETANMYAEFRKYFLPQLRQHSPAVETPEHTSNGHRN